MVGRLEWPSALTYFGPRVGRSSMRTFGYPRIRPCNPVGVRRPPSYKAYIYPEPGPTGSFLSVHTSLSHRQQFPARYIECDASSCHARKRYQDSTSNRRAPQTIQGIILDRDCIRSAGGERHDLRNRISKW